MRMNVQAFFVFAIHINEWDHNKTKPIEAIPLAAIAKLDAVSKGLCSAEAACDKAGGLVRTLYIYRGAKVTLNANIYVKFGLFNGSMCTVQDILCLNGRTPKDSLPDVVMVGLALHLFHRNPKLFQQYQSKKTWLQMWRMQT